MAYWLAYLHVTFDSRVVVAHKAAFEYFLIATFTERNTHNMPPKKRPSELQSVDNDAYFHSKKSKTSADHFSTAKVDSNGDRYWEISRMRRVTISSFRGKTLVNVREYYEKDGQELPGKKVSRAHCHCSLRDILCPIPLTIGL